MNSAHDMKTDIPSAESSNVQIKHSIVICIMKREICDTL